MNKQERISELKGKIVAMPREKRQLTMRIEVQQLPPVEYSLNWRGHWAQRYKAGGVYGNAVFYSAVDARNRLQEGVHLPFTKAKLDLVFVFPEYRRRDKDNLLARFKPGLDAIVRADLIIDDDAEHLEISSLAVLVDSRRAPLTIITLDEIKRLEQCAD